MLFEFETTATFDKSREKVYDEQVGFIKGNMFPELYEGYKNYKPQKLVASNERDAMLLHIMSLDFALNDLNLYLATHPEDQSAYELFKTYSLTYAKCLQEYESKYQVLELCHDTYGKYTWSSNPWPWEEDKYV